MKGATRAHPDPPAAVYTHKKATKHRRFMYFHNTVEYMWDMVGLIVILRDVALYVSTSFCVALENEWSMSPLLFVHAMSQ